LLPGLLANYEMTQRSNPALSKPVNRKSLPMLPNQIGRARSALHQGQELVLQQRPNTFAQTILSLSFFACDETADHTFWFARYSGCNRPRCPQLPYVFGQLYSGMLAARFRDRLLISQSDHRIDAHGATGGNVACEKRHSEKHSSHGYKCKRVTGANAVEQAGHHTREA
jgi:hypothetical protein